MRSVVLSMSWISKGGDAQRVLLALGNVAPEETVWSVQEARRSVCRSLPQTAGASGAFSVSRSLVDLAETVIQAHDPQRFALLYALIWRAHRGEKHAA